MVERKVMVLPTTADVVESCMVKPRLAPVPPFFEWLGFAAVEVHGSDASCCRWTRK